MKKKAAIHLLCVLLFPFYTFGLNVDSLLADKIHVPKPYLIINVTSTDCIVCRAGGLKILNKLKGSSYKDKIIILSDDRNMAPYFRENADKYDGYQKIYDRTLSQALALGPSCSATLVQDKDTHIFLFNDLNDDTLNYFKQVLDNKPSEMYRSEKIRDSAFSDVTDLNFGNDHTILFNYRFQIGLQYDRSTHAMKYIAPSASDTMLGMIYDKVKKATGWKLSDAKTTRDLMHRMGTPDVMIEGMNERDNSVLFKFYTIAMDTTYKGTDTMINAQSRMAIMLERNATGKSDVFNADNYNSSTFFDSIHYQKDTLWPYTHIGYEVVNGHIYLPYIDYSHSQKRVDHGREITMPTAISIVEFTNNGNEKPGVCNAYRIEGLEGGSDFFFRVDDKGNPVVVNKTGKKITFLNDNRKVDFSDLVYADGETVSIVFDISVANDTLKFIGLTNKNNAVKGIYNIKSKETTVNKLNDNVAYQSMRINGNSILGCQKNEGANELLFDWFDF